MCVCVCVCVHALVRVSNNVICSVYKEWVFNIDDRAYTRVRKNIENISKSFEQIYFNMIFLLQPSREIWICAAPFSEFFSRDFH